MKRIALLPLVTLLAACAAATSTPLASPAPGEINFTIAVGENPGGSFTISLGVENHGAAAIPANRFRSAWLLTSTSGEARASGEGLLPQIEPDGGRVQNVVVWEGVIEPGGYALQWGAPALGSSSAHFEIVAGENGPRLGTLTID